MTIDTFLTLLMSIIGLIFVLGIFFAYRDSSTYFQILELEKIGENSYRVHGHYHKWFSGHRPTTYICEDYSYRGVVRELETGELIGEEHGDLLFAMGKYFANEKNERAKAEFIDKYKSEFLK